MPDRNEPFNPTGATKGNGPNPFNSNPGPETGPRDPKLQSAGVSWPVTHGSVIRIDGRWAFRSGEDELTTLPDDLADELNRLATIDACARICWWEDYPHFAVCIGDRNDEAIIDLHARLVQETKR